jgi:hypothetical protein
MYSLKKSYINILFFSLIFICFYSCSAPKQRGEFPMYPSIEKKEKFFADPVTFYDSDSSNARLDLFIEIPYGNIIFKKNISTGNFEFKITQTIIITNLTNKNIIIKTYDDSAAYSNDEMIIKSRESHYYLYNYFIDPGNYKIEIKVKDNNSKDEYKKSFDLSVKDYKSSEVAFSDLMLLSKYKINEDGSKEITPLISNDIFGLKEFFVFFEIYSRTNNDITKEYVYKLKDNKDVIIKEDAFTYTLSPGNNQKVENIFVLKELKKYIPEELDFDFFLYDNEQNISFKLEIIDKSNNEIVASKKLAFVPKMLGPEMNKKPPMR